MAAQPGQLVPRLAAVGRAEQGGVFDAGVDGVRIGQRRLEMPDALELPGMLRAVVPLVRGEGLAGFGRRVVDELVALALGHAVRSGGRLAGRCSGLVPRLAAVVGALDDLPEPAAGLRRIQPVRVNGRSLEVVDLPARKVRTTDVPPFALAVRRQDERALAGANQYSYLAHPLLLILEISAGQDRARSMPRGRHPGALSHCIVERANSRSTPPGARRPRRVRGRPAASTPPSLPICIAGRRCPRRGAWSRQDTSFSSSFRPTGQLGSEVLRRRMREPARSASGRSSRRGSRQR